ncbi:MAG: LTA synthase family protein [Bacteroidales bacterium]|nr:LTA synthase family protein [Bacteroidales bacterium]
MKYLFRNYYTGIRFKGNLYLVLVLHFLFLMLLFSVCRVLFFLFNKGFYPNTTLDSFVTILWGGLQFDTAAILYINILYFFFFLLPFTFRYNVWYQRVLKYLFVITNGVALGANCADFIYFQFTMRRTTATVFDEFKNETNFASLIPQFIADYWYVFLIWFALTALLVLFYRKIQKPKVLKGFKYHAVYFVNGLVLMLVFVTLMVGGVRGGYRHSTRPITLSNAGKYVHEPLEVAIVLNTPFAIFRTLQKQSLKKVDYFTPDELQSRYNPVHSPVSVDSMRRSNVVIFILESFGREYFQHYNEHLKDQGFCGYTPFLDSLIDKGFYFRNSFANGRKSIDAMPSALASIPMMVEPYFLTSYSGNRINSIASLLRDEGYYTAFFHGAPNGSMGFQAFANVAGFQDYYGLSEYPSSDGFDGMWGVWDEEFFQFFADKLNGFQQPFCAAIFSLSSHHPFKVPERYEGRFPKGTLPIHQCVAYTDYSLRRFFDKVSSMPWFDNTLFVFTADHANQSYYPEYKTNVGVFTVPLIFYTPDGSMVGKSDSLAQQIDIMPSILGYLNYPKPFLAFGRNVFGSTQEPFVINYTSNTYQLFVGNYLLLYDGAKVTGLFEFKTDRLLETNLIGKLPEVELRMVKKVKAIIQQYNNRMIGDSLTVK